MKHRFATIATIACALSACGGSSDGSPDSVIEGYRDAYNARELDEMMDLFADDAVLIGHPFSELAQGRGEIQAVLQSDLAGAAASDAYTWFNIGVDGTTVTWDAEFMNARGKRWCATGHTAVVEAGVIIEWAFAPDRKLCG